MVMNYAILRLVVVFMFLFPSSVLAEMSGYLFLGKYLNYKQTDLEGREVKYIAGIYLEYETRWPVFFLKEETLIGDVEGRSSYPKQINYLIGMKQKIKSIDIILKHECRHPVDGMSGGMRAESYDLIEGRINF